MRIIVCLLLALSTIASASANETQEVGGWQDNEQLVGKYRSGISPSGLWYEYNQEGRGGIGLDPKVYKWRFECSVDAMTDVRTCLVISAQNRLLLSVSTRKHASVLVCVVGHDHPGHNAMIRVDTNKAFASEWRSCFRNRELISQLSEGEGVMVRWYKWPSGRANDTEGRLLGLGEALELAAFLRDNLVNTQF